MSSPYPPESIIADGYRGSRSTIPEEVRAEIVDLAEQGTGRNEIARRVGLSTRTVSRIATAVGLEFSEDRTEKASRARLLQLQAKRLDQAEQLHLSLSMALALAQGQMINEPSNHRGRAEATRAVRELASAYEALLKIDANDLARAALLEDAYAFLDQVEIVIHGTDHGVAVPHDHGDPDPIGTDHAPAESDPPPPTPRGDGRTARP